MSVSGAVRLGGLERAMGKLKCNPSNQIRRFSLLTSKPNPGLRGIAQTRRNHALMIQSNKNVIRQHIRSLELSRRKFSTTSVFNHGHVDPPKPGEE